MTSLLPKQTDQRNQNSQTGNAEAKYQLTNNRATPKSTEHSVIFVSKVCDKEHQARSQPNIRNATASSSPMLKSMIILRSDADWKPENIASKLSCPEVFAVTHSRPSEKMKCIHAR